MPTQPPTIISLVKATWGEVDWILPVLATLKKLRPEWRLITVVPHTFDKRAEIGPLRRLLGTIVDEIVYFNVTEPDLSVLGIEQPGQVKAILEDIDPYPHYNPIREAFPDARSICVPHSPDLTPLQPFNSTRSFGCWDFPSVDDDLRLVDFEELFPRAFDMKPDAKLCAVGVPRIDSWWRETLIAEPEFQASAERSRAEAARRTVVFLLSDSNRKGSAEMFRYVAASGITAALEDPDTFLLLKPHPRLVVDQLAFIHAITSSFPERCMLTNAHAIQLASLADVIFATRSGCTLECLASGKPFIELSPQISPCAGWNMNSFGQMVSCYALHDLSVLCRTKEELKLAFQDAIETGGTGERWVAQQQSLRRFVPEDAEASICTANVILREIGEHVDQTLPPVFSATDSPEKADTLFVAPSSGDNKLHLELRPVHGYGTPVCSPLLHELRDALDLRDAIVTGSANVALLSATAEIFEQTHVIEVDADLNRIKKFAAYPSSGKIAIADSASVLKQTLTSAGTRALFILGPHRLAPFDPTGVTTETILAELNAIKDASPEQTAIVITGLRHFSPAGHPESPSLADLFSVISSFEPMYSCAVLGDVAIAYPADVISVSDGVHALTASRLFDGTNFDLSEVLKADEFLAEQLPPHEAIALQRLPLDYGKFEEPNRGGHYWYWAGLVSYGQGDYANAVAMFTAAKERGCETENVLSFLNKAAERSPTTTRTRA